MTTVTAADAISRRRRVKARNMGAASTSPVAWLRCMRNRAFAEATTIILLQHTFVEGLANSTGDPVDPDAVHVETFCDDAGNTTVRLMPETLQAVDLHCSPQGFLMIIGSDGRKAEVTEWRDIPNVLPNFLGV